MKTSQLHALLLEPHDRIEELPTAESGEAQVEESDLYTLGNLEGLNYRAVFHLSGKLSQIRFRRSSNAISRINVYRFQSRSCSGFSSRGDYKTEVMTET